MFELTANRSYDVFLLEPGTKLTLIASSIIKPQPSLTITHDTQLFITKTITRTLDKTCHEITISEKMDCIIDNIGRDLLSNGSTCLPFYFHHVFSKFYPEFSECKDNTSLTYIWDIFTVRYNFTTFEMIYDMHSVFRPYGWAFNSMQNNSAQLYVKI